MINPKQALKTALKSLGANKLRSFLTILGIVIGVGAIVLIVSLGDAAKTIILQQIEGLGSKTIAVLPGREPKGPTDVAQIFSDSLKKRDLDALTKKGAIPNLSKIMPIVFGGESASYKNETYRFTLMGVTDLITDIFNLSLEEGTFFSDDDIKNKASVVILGHKVAEELFNGFSPIGKKIKIKNRSFQVIGTLPKKGQVSFFNFDDVVLVPYTTAQQYIFGIKHFHRLFVAADTEENVDQVAQDIKRVLRISHDITDPEKDDFFVHTQKDIVERFGIITNVLTLFLTAIAAISLVVGGIGIMNIMLVSVTERTREIGLRKAIGATNYDIMFQFLLEAVILTVIGGIIGIFISVSLSFLITVVLNQTVAIGWKFTFPLQANIIALLVSASVGFIFGLYPAQQAAKKDPIEALRYE